MIHKNDIWCFIEFTGSISVPDEALQRMCYVARFLLADRYDVRNLYYRNYGRFAVMSKVEVTTDIPEHADLDHCYDTYTRGMGATLERPVTTTGEANLLCYSTAYMWVLFKPWEYPN